MVIWTTPYFFGGAFGIVSLLVAFYQFDKLSTGRDRNWNSYLLKRGPALVRILLCPPPSLQAQVKATFSPQDLDFLKKAAEDNTLEAVMSKPEGIHLAETIITAIL